MLKSSILDSRGEKEVCTRLKKFEPHLRVYVGVRFFRVVPYDLEGLNQKEHEFLNTTEFDFVVCMGDADRPHFAIEYDGIGDNFKKIDQHRPLKQAAKRKACQLAGFPLIEIGELREIEGVSILEAIVESYLGGRAVSSMIAFGHLSWEESFVYDFPPLRRLNAKYRFCIQSSLVETIQFDDVPTVERTTVFLTNENPISIKKRAKVRSINFPHFHDLELADDIALYRSLQEFEERLNKGEYSIVEIKQQIHASSLSLQGQIGSR